MNRIWNTHKLQGETLFFSVTEMKKTHCDGNFSQNRKTKSKPHCSAERWDCSISVCVLSHTSTHTFVCVKICDNKHASDILAATFDLPLAFLSLFLLSVCADESCLALNMWTLRSKRTVLKSAQLYCNLHANCYCGWSETIGDISWSVFGPGLSCCGGYGDVCVATAAGCPAGYRCGRTGFLKCLTLKASAQTYKQ